MSSLNIGTPAVEAARALRDDPRWVVIREALLEQVRIKTNAALDNGGSAMSADIAGYARALRDLWTAFESATTGAKIQQVKQPGPVEKSRV